ncbi:MAG: hypothetical protein HOY69_24655 [Streptomyces sp.]|nr:hypothetical protein [Streptomyces sp.]
MTTIQRRAASRLAAGTAILTKRIGSALAPEQRPIATVIRCGGALWGSLRLLDIAHQAPAVLVAGTGIWCLSAWKASDPAASEPTTTKAADAERKEPKPAANQKATEATEEPDEQAEFLALLHDLMPGTIPGRDDRIHLAQIAAEWTGNPADTPTVRALLAEAGITPTACRVPNRGSSTGIYLRDVPPLPHPSPAPLSGVVGGSDQQQQQQQRSEAATEKGFWTKSDPDHPHQSIIEWENAS